MITKNYTLAFVIGMLSTFISLIPSVMAILKNPKKRGIAKLEKKILWLPYFYGFVSILIIIFMHNVLPTKLNNYWIMGAIVAILYSSMGRFGGLVTNVYEMDTPNLIHIYALMLYIPLYGIVFRTLAENLNQ